MRLKTPSVQRFRVLVVGAKSKAVTVSAKAVRTEWAGHSRSLNSWTNVACVSFQTTVCEQQSIRFPPYVEGSAKSRGFPTMVHAA